MPYKVSGGGGGVPNGVAISSSVVIAYKDATKDETQYFPLAEMSADMPVATSKWWRAKGVDNHVNDGATWIKTVVPSFAEDVERYPWIWYEPTTCELYYYDVLRASWFKKVWRRIKGFCKKAWKALPKVLGVAKKVATVVAPVIPPPYGTAVAGIASATGAVSNALNLIGNVSQKSTGLALMDTSEDKFIVTPQYRVSSSDTDYIMPNIPGNEYVPNTMYDGEWISADPIEVPVTGTSAVTKSTVFALKDHPNYENIKQYVATALQANVEKPLWF